ncbi:MAG: hypothetical protein C0490_02050 [Marivirga sp.]|nr:hypothetical protein [Marivirga sp.]
MLFSSFVRINVAAVLLTFIFSSTTEGQTVFPLSDTSVIYRLDPYVGVLIDATEILSVDDVANAGFESSKGNLTFGYLKSVIWLKVKTKASPSQQWYLEIPAPFLEYVDFYQAQEDGKWHHSTAGYFKAHSAREISHTSHVIALTFLQDSSSTVLIRIAGSSPKTFPLLVKEREKFIETVRIADLAYGVFFGILIVMFFYNLFIYLTLNQENYLLYICTIVCTFLIFSSATGYAGKYLWPETPLMNFYAGRLTLGILTIFLSIFTIRFLEVKQYSKILYYTLLSLIPLGILSMILVATGLLSSAGNNLITISTLVYMTTGIVCRIKGNKAATYFIAAWTIYLIGGLLLTLRNSGFFDFNFWTTHFVEIGAAAETIIIAFALGDRYRLLRKEKEEAQLLAFKIQQDATDRLEMKVKQRTEQLSKTNEELQTTLETNKLQTQIIENKNAELDAFFYRISHDLKGPISSLLGLSTLAKMDVKDAQALSYMDLQHQQVERLNNIITGLINLTKLSHSELQKSKIDFEQMVEGCIVSFNGLKNFSQIDFKKNIQPGIEFYSEWTLVNTILQNLIENAIKYSRGSSPFVYIRIVDDSGFIAIEVSDNGQGIPEEHQTKIFEMFYRATQNASGSGLGLYILKRSVDRLKGSVELKSKSGEGSTFTVKLPHAQETRYRE